MQKLLFVIFLTVFFNLTLSAQYAIMDIPEAMTEDANIVIRNSETVWKITSKESATVYRKKVVSLMNEDARGYAIIKIPYDSFRKISDIKIRLYDAEGNSVKVKAKHLQDVNTSIGSFEIGDARVKFLDLSDIEYPFSYELEYETKMKGILAFPSWVPQYTVNMSVEKASISIETKDGYQLRYKEINLDGQAKATKDDEGNKVWTVENLSAIKNESFQEDIGNTIPILKMAPNDFSLEGYEGSMKSWNGYGVWYNQLLKDTKDFPDSMKDDIREMVKDQSTDIDKIKTIYEYLQDNTRYVSIQLGIGGLKPFDPDFVHEKKYGDCKALSFYTKAMLESVDINSNLVLVRSGGGALEVDADFPSDQFNHVFLCVPQEKDTIWLECTSQSNPFGYLGDFTSDRNVLVIEKNGATLTRTPKYGKEDNTIIADVKLDITVEGAATGIISQKYNGLEYDRTHFSYQFDQSEKDQEDWIKNNYDISDFDLKKFEFLANAGDSYLGELKSDVHINKLASTVGKRMFFKPIVVDKLKKKKIKNPEERANNFEIRDTYRHKGTFEYKTPADFKVEKNVKEYDFTNKFGSYSLKVKSAEEGKIIIERVFEINDGEFPANEYVDFIAFLNKIKKADNQKIAMVMTKEP